MWVWARVESALLGLVQRETKKKTAILRVPVLRDTQCIGFQDRKGQLLSATWKLEIPPPPPPPHIDKLSHLDLQTLFFAFWCFRDLYDEPNSSDIATTLATTHMNSVVSKCALAMQNQYTTLYLATRQ